MTTPTSARDPHGDRLRTLRVLPALALAALWLWALPVSAEDAPVVDSAVEAAPPSELPAVPLDRLLRLPAGVSYDVEKRGGLTRSEWRARFTRRTRERDEAKLALEASQKELSEMAAKTDAWNLGTPGTGASAEKEDPLSFRLDQRIRRERKTLEETEQKLEALKTEANLAKVPKAWREPSSRPPESNLANEDW